MADIVLINPKFEVSYWGMEYALPYIGKRANLPVAALPLLAALTPAGHTVTLSPTTNGSGHSGRGGSPMSAIQPTKLIGDGSKHHHHIRHGHTTSRTKVHSGRSRTAGRQAGFTPGDPVRRSAGRTAAFLRFYHRIVPSCLGETMVLALENL